LFREDFPLSRRFDMRSLDRLSFTVAGMGGLSVNFIYGICNTERLRLMVDDSQSGGRRRSPAPPEDFLNLVSLSRAQEVLWLTEVTTGHLWLNFSLWAYGDGGR
jgi:hypothetical protein